MQVRNKVVNQIAPTAIIHQNVELGENIIIEDFCVIGQPVNGSSKKTIIGNNSHIRSGTIIYQGNKIGNSFVTGNKANIRENNLIGDNVSIGTLTVIEYEVIIENNVRVHSQAFVPEFSILKEKCWIGPNVVLTNARYPVSPNVKENLKGPIIEKNSIVGANSTLLPGVIVGENSIVGAGSVVTKNVGNGEVVAGNPAKKINNKNNLPY